MAAPKTMNLYNLQSETLVDKVEEGLNVSPLAAAPTDGSAAQKIIQIENILSSGEKWLGKLTTPAGDKVTDPLITTAFQATTSATAATFGTAIQIFDNSDTPVFAGETHFQIKRIRVSAVGDASKTWRIRLAWGAASYAASVTAGGYSEIVVTEIGLYDLYLPVIAAGTEVWAAAQKADSTASTIDFQVSVVEF